MTESLQLHIQKLLPGCSMPWQKMESFFQTSALQKDTILLSENAPCEQIYFVNKGCLYLYYEHNHQKEVIHFALENWWITDYKTFCEGKPAEYAIATMEDSVITSLSRKQYEALQLAFPLMALYFNKIHERAYGAALYKQKSYATISKKDFYHYFKTTYPEIIKRIPDAIFASYIGVSTETLKAFRQTSIS